MTMKRRQFLSAGALATGGLTATLAAPGLGQTSPAQTNLAQTGLAQSAPAVTWRLTSSFPKSLDIPFGTAQMFAKYVADATDNAFKIQIFAAGEIAPGLQALDAVTSGSAECAHTPAGFYIAKDPTLCFGSGLPFGLDQRHQQAWLAQGGGAAILNESLKKFNAFGLAMGASGAQSGGWFRRDIATIDDFSGLKIRIGGMGAQVMARLGAAPQDITRQEIATALENGTLDAATFAGPYDDEKLGLARVAKSYYGPGWWDSSAAVHLMINLDAWAKLPKAYQAVVAQASGAANAWMLAKYDTLNGPALRRLVAAGTMVKTFPVPVLEACLKASGDQYAEFAAQNPLFKKALDSMNAYRAGQLAWWQISDQALDTFTNGPHGKG